MQPNPAQPNSTPEFIKEKENLTLPMPNSVAGGENGSFTNDLSKSSTL